MHYIGTSRSSGIEGWLDQGTQGYAGKRVRHGTIEKMRQRSRGSLKSSATTLWQLACHSFHEDLLIYHLNLSIVRQHVRLHSKAGSPMPALESYLCAAPASVSTFTATLSMAPPHVHVKCKTCDVSV